MSENSVRSSFSGKIGYVLAVAGSAVGMGNIWRFPYLTAKHGGAIFLLVYIILLFTFGYAMVLTETALGRKCKKGPVGTYALLCKNHPIFARFGGWLNAIIALIIVPYYCVIGGWVCKFLFEYLCFNGLSLAEDSYFSSFISNNLGPELYLIVFATLTMGVIILGVEKGIEKLSKILMPALVVLAVIVSIYSITRPGAVEGLKYLFIPNFSAFSFETLLAALGQLFYSLSVAMGILFTYGSYMKKDVNIEESTKQIELFDTGIAILAAVMIVPAVFSYSNGDPNALNAGPGLMFITLPKMFASMPFGSIIAIVFFVLVFFAAITSSISLAETCVATISEECKISRRMSIIVTSIIIIALGSLSALGYGVLSDVTIIKLQFLDFFDFISNSLMMPIAALCTTIMVVYFAGLKSVSDEIELSGKFKRKAFYGFLMKYFTPACLVVILIYFLSSYLFG